MNLKLHTKRLTLIPFEEDDSSLFHEINTNPFVRKYLWDDQLISEETAEEILRQNEQHFNVDDFGLWKICIQGQAEVIGYVGLWYFFDEPQPQLIYTLLEQHTKKGYAKEAAEAIITYAFDQLNYDYLIAATDEPHKDSQKVATSLGMSCCEKRTEDGKPTLFFKIEKPGHK